MPTQSGGRMDTVQGGTLLGGNDPLGGTARWPHAPGGLPSAYGQAFHRPDDEEPVFGRGTMKRNSQHYVEQASNPNPNRNRNPTAIAYPNLTLTLILTLTLTQPQPRAGCRPRRRGPAHRAARR